ncbi:MAG TPA: hypothetical protein ENN51_02630 [candidate division WOR-3 bacterium]|uniref:Uncharacterized protein n=1 Tax=candidate division WOR-3 bacterium TaxID=2052148 RepID=A0A7V0T575_UNCW3|nr:hypothetical protein [candidate division WOR-3 bacterium]
MRIVIDHVTRMRPDRVCVAGVELATARHVRPVLMRGQLRRKLVERPGAPFNIGCLADIGAVTLRPRAPAIEDARFNSRRARRLGAIPAPEFWKMLRGMARPALREVLGPDLRPEGEHYVVDAGRGRASLGTLLPRRVSGPVVIEVERGGRTRPRVVIEVEDEYGDCRLPVTDLRLWEPDQRTPRREAIADVARRVEEGAKVILSVGLTRPMHRGLCWLQVNNIHLEDNPVWQVNERQSWLGRLLGRGG